ncbi:dolichyl-diphosphooligosaccharide--protein glycosyltransferase subunit 1-like [Schistocerca gregaria]|uniref:dolichyl-diphosphooligosaccharide--protein glycosyltransferase subunit 1-like n=1 Tax=Schistocerca gregaria TaxID=7010 RepID=UPI00211E32DF|nr:dolichyl-diphosphooligosaccharide--protein glycosyltransferase subunit 1-like [Schistocerca gregaria]
MNRVSTLPISFFFIACFFTCLSVQCQKNPSNTLVEYELDLGQTVAQHYIHIDVLNGKKEKLEVYNISMQDQMHKNVCNFSVESNGQFLEYKTNPKHVKKNDKIIKDVYMYSIILDPPLEQDQSTSLIVKMLTRKSITPVQSSIPQTSHSFLVQHNGSSTLFSPYKTEILNMRIHLKGKLEEINASVPYQFDSQSFTVTLDTQYKLSSFTQTNLSLKFWSNHSLVSFSHLERTVKVSHWINTVINNTVSIENLTPKIKGAFSRLRQESDPFGGLPILDVQQLADHAINPKYGDVLGKIHSFVHEEDRLMLVMRYPLFGGWKTMFYTSYDSPLNEIASISGSWPIKVTLKLKFIPVYYPVAQINKAVMNVVLPKGAFNVNVAPSCHPENYVVTYETRKQMFSQMWIAVIKRTPLSTYSSDEEITITYDYPPWFILQTPLLYAAIYYVLCSILMIVRHLFSPSPDSPSKEKTK